MYQEKEVESIHLPAEFAMRPAKIEDIEPLVALMNLCDRHQGQEGNSKPEDVQSEWKTPDFTLEGNTRVILDSAGEIVGYAEVWDTMESPIDPYVWGCVSPQHEGKGIGTALLSWAENRMRSQIHRCPEDAKVVMVAGTLSSYQPTHQLFKDFGMKPSRYFWDMEIRFDGVPTPPQFPSGIEIEIYQHDQDLRKVAQALWDSFQDHFGFNKSDSIESDMKYMRHIVENGSRYEAGLWFMAMDGDQVAGICLCSKHDRDSEDFGYVSTLGVCRPWRRQGLGTALLLHAFDVFNQRGKLGCRLGVDADSLTGATRLYENAGMSVRKQFDTYEKELRAGKEYRNLGDESG